MRASATSARSRSTHVGAGGRTVVAWRPTAEALVAVRGTLAADVPVSVRASTSLTTGAGSSSSGTGCMGGSSVGMLEATRRANSSKCLTKASRLRMLA